jgi:hypothetical protein
MRTIHDLLREMRAIEGSYAVVKYHQLRGTLPQNGIHGYHPLGSAYTETKVAIWYWMNTGEIPQYAR